MREVWRGAGRLPVFLAAAIALGTPAAALACRCVPMGPAAHAKYAEAIVLGEIVDAKDGDLNRSYDVRVTKSWKQRLTGRITIGSARTTCMAYLEKGQTYLIYLRRSEGGGYRTDGCAGNVTAKEAPPAIAAIKGRAFR